MDRTLQKQNKVKIYEGDTKIIYQGIEEFTLIQFFKDDLRISPEETIIISGKGVINNSISAYIMNCLDMVGIENHLIEKLNMREQLVQLVDTFPVKVIVTNIATDRYVRDFGIEEGYVFEKPMIDFRFKSSIFPVVNETQIINFNWMMKEELDNLKKAALRINDFLVGFFAAIGIRLVDCSLEFGRVFNGEEFVIMLVDEISPDTCRLIDMNNNQKLDFEFASENPDKATTIYKEIAKRLKVA